MKSMKTIFGAAVIASGLTFGFAPAPAQAQNMSDILRVIVNVSDIVYRGGVPYYRYGNYGPQDRIIIVREGGRDRYYRNVPRGNAYGYYGNAPRGNAYGYYGNAPRRVVYVNDRSNHSRNRYNRHDDRRWDDNRRWDDRRGRDDDRRWGQRRDRDDDNDQGNGRGRGRGGR